MNTSGAQQQPATGRSSTTPSLASAAPSARDVGPRPAPVTSGGDPSASPDTSASVPVGLRLFVRDGNGRMPTRRSRRVWTRLGEQLLGSCRSADTTSWDRETLTLIFACADPHSALTARARILEAATRSWARVGTKPALAVEDVYGDLPDRHGPLPRPAPDFLDRPPPAARSFLKRVMDIAGAVVGLVALSPLMGLVALGIRGVSPGPVLFRQRRIGAGGVPFTMLKFRTMRHGADDEVHRAHVQAYITGGSAPSGEHGSVKLAADQRIFPLGAFLRRWSLDELPQLLNVLAGSMSLVGPRPSVDYELRHYEDWHAGRLAVKPGITGLWQVCGRGRTPFDQMTRMDIRYIRTWSVWQDVKLIARTFPAVLSRAGAG